MHWSTLRSVLAGSDGPRRRALPLGEFMHPVPLVALVVLVVNDHVLKGSGLLPAAVTGKLSDFAGVLFFPLLLTALTDTFLYGLVRVGVGRIDFTLRRYKLWLAMTVTAAIFSVLQLSPRCAALAEVWLDRIGLHSQITPDPVDLVALVMLVPATLLGLAEIRRIPLGRLEYIARQRFDDRSKIAAALADVRRLHADKERVDTVVGLIGRAECEAELARALGELRGQRL